MPMSDLLFWSAHISSANLSSPCRIHRIWWPETIVPTCPDSAFLSEKSLTFSLFHAPLHLISKLRVFFCFPANLGIVQSDMGRYDDAIVSFKQAMSLSPRLAEAPKCLGDTYKHVSRSVTSSLFKMMTCDVSLSHVSPRQLSSGCRRCWNVEGTRTSMCQKVCAIVPPSNARSSNISTKRCRPGLPTTMKCWTALAVVENVLKVLEVVDLLRKCWRALEVVENVLKVLEVVELLRKCWRALEVVENVMKVLEVVELSRKSRRALEDINNRGSLEHHKFPNTSSRWESRKSSKSQVSWHTKFLCVHECSNRSFTLHDDCVDYRKP